MDIQFPEEKDPFPRTMRNAILASIVAIAFGILLGNAFAALFGLDPSIVHTSEYTDIMSAVKTMFTDADQTDSYMQTAEKFHDMDGLRLLASKDHKSLLAWYDGRWQNAADVFDEDTMASLLEMMNTEEALYGVTDTGGNAIEGVRLWNLAVVDEVVIYYLYYDDAGYVAIAYDHTEDTLSKLTDNYIPLFDNAEGDIGIWDILYYIDDSQ